MLTNNLNLTTADLLPLLAVLGLLVWLLALAWRRARRESETARRLLQEERDTIDRRMERLRLSVDVGQTAGVPLDLQELLQNAVERIKTLFDYYHVSIYLLEDDGRVARIHESSGKVGEILKNRNHTIQIGPGSLIGTAVLAGEPQVVPDVSTSPVYQENPLLPETRSELVLPLRAHGETLGVLDVQSRQVNSFSPEEITVLQLMANQIASGVENAHLFREQQQRLNETQAVLNMITMLTTTLDVAEIYRRAARVYTEQLNVARCAVSSWRRAENAVFTEAEFIHDRHGRTVMQYDPADPEGPYSLDKHTGTRQVLETGQPLVRYVADPKLEESERRILQELGHTLSLEVAMSSGEQVYGIIELFRDSHQPAFSPTEIQIAQAMASQVATALRNAQLTSEAQGRAAQLGMLNRVSRILSMADDIRDVFDGARREIFAMTDCTGMSIMLLAENRNYLEWAYGYEYGRIVSIPHRYLPVSQGFSGYVARTGEPLLINERFEEERERFQSFTVGRPAAAWLGVPLIVVNEITGVLVVENGDDPQALTERDTQLLTTIAGPLAITIQNQRLLQQMQEALITQSEMNLQLQTAAEVAAGASTTHDVNELMQTAVDLIQQRFNRYHVGISLLDEESNHAVLRAATGATGRKLIAEGFSVPIDNTSLVGATMTDGESRIVPDVFESNEWLPNENLPNVRSGVSLPLKVRNRIIGALSVQSAQVDDFPPGLIRVLQTMSDLLAVAIDNARLLAEAEARASRQQTLNEISALMHRSADVETIIGIALEAMSQHLAGSEIELVIGETIPAAENGHVRDGQ